MKETSRADFPCNFIVKIYTTAENSKPIHGFLLCAKFYRYL